jgi:hypothetical protein
VCLIVDSNVVHRVLLDPTDKDFRDIYVSLFGKGRVRAVVVYGGRLLEEYGTSARVIRALAALDRAGRARAIPAQTVGEETSKVIQSGLCVSNDHHVIALARVSGVRLLCSNDQPLHQDFTNKKVIDKPRGKVYQKRKHKPLLARFCR